MKNEKKAVVLLSGGLDSSTCLALAVKNFGSRNVFALNMFYGQKHDKEIESSKNIAGYYCVPYFEMDMSCVMKYSDCSLLQHSDKDIEHKSYVEQLKDKKNGVVDTYVPFRNGLFLSAATAFAISKNANIVMYGAHSDDAAGNAYPDCTVKFAKYIGKAILEGSGGTVCLETPFINVNKSKIVRTGLELNVPYELTWSCYEGGDKPCGECGTCIDRAKAFQANGITDPLITKGETV